MISKWVCTFGGVGLAPVAPGTVGSIAAMVFCWIVLPSNMSSASILAFLIAVVSSVLGMWAIPLYSPKELDHKSIVIDEVAGLAVCYAICFLLMPMALKVAGPIGLFKSFPSLSLALLPVGFVFFRIFDIWKPGWIGYYDRIKSPFATIMDDLLAGCFAAVPTLILFIL